MKLRLLSALLEQIFLLGSELIAPKTRSEHLAEVHAEKDGSSEPLRDHVESVERDLGLGAIERARCHGSERGCLEAHDYDAVNGNDVLRKRCQREAESATLQKTYQQCSQTKNEPCGFASDPTD